MRKKFREQQQQQPCNQNGRPLQPNERNLIPVSIWWLFIFVVIFFYINKY